MRKASQARKATTTAETRIGELRNLGPVCQRDLERVGIRSLGDIRANGVEAVFLKVWLDRRRSKPPRPAPSINLLFALHGAIYDEDWRSLPDCVKQKFQKFVQQLRDEAL
jgi:hypothetical protein